MAICICFVCLACANLLAVLMETRVLLSGVSVMCFTFCSVLFTSGVAHPCRFAGNVSVFCDLFVCFVWNCAVICVAFRRLPFATASFRSVAYHQQKMMLFCRLTRTTSTRTKIVTGRRTKTKSETESATEGRKRETKTHTHTLINKKRQRTSFCLKLQCHYHKQMRGLRFFNFCSRLPNILFVYNLNHLSARLYPHYSTWISF